MTSINQQLLQICALVDQQIKDLLPKAGDRLSDAMGYSALSSGKRLRPFMLVMAADMWQVKRSYSLRAAAAVEIIHCYSLIHDDLPAMDNDDYRRGLPSCHKKFDEATAILAGDSLLSLAFEILADQETHPDPEIRCKLIQILAKNIGSQGMAGGQIWDLIYEREKLAGYPELVKMQSMKTAQLFVACCQMGATLGYADDHAQLNLSNYAKNFGLAFQFIDDIEDIAKKTSLTNNNVVKLIGEKETLAAAKKFIDAARIEISFFAEKGIALDQLACLLLE